MKTKLMAALIAAAFAPAAFAGTCAAPTPLMSNSVVNGSTCGGQIGINMAGIIFGHPSQVYSFTWEDQGEVPNVIDLTGPDMAMVLSTSCTEAPFAFGGPGAGPLDLVSAGLTDGQTYILVVSTDPSVPVADPPVCNDFVLTPGTLPVSLQDFSVE